MTHMVIPISFGRCREKDMRSFEDISNRHAKWLKQHTNRYDHNREDKSLCKITVRIRDRNERERERESPLPFRTFAVLHPLSLSLPQRRYPTLHRRRRRQLRRRSPLAAPRTRRPGRRRGARSPSESRPVRVRGAVRPLFSCCRAFAE